MKQGNICILLTMVAILAGCASSGQRAPVFERGEAQQKTTISTAEARKKISRETDWRPRVYVVQKGDTLYSIAFNHGFDYHELAELNGIQDPTMIQVGQQIQLFSTGAVPIIPPAAVESKPIEPAVREQPKVMKYAYSEAAMVQIDKVQETARTEAVMVQNKPEPAPKPQAKPDSKTDSTANDGDDEALEWSMPTHGKLLAEFSESANRKGIDIGGKLGQPITASAPGKVVYSGSGLRGYGKLVIIKHNKTYLSAYAHNDQVLVKEGQMVTRGQKIAEMGNTDADLVKLHFEVRRFGKPVDPAKYLPLGKS